MTRIRLRGFDDLQRVLGSLDDAIDVLDAPMRRAMFRLQRDMANYPPPPAASAYIRTGTLGRTWTTDVERRAGGMVGKVGNRTRYAPMVQSQRFQSRVHRGRWQTDRQVLRQNMPNIERDFDRAIQGALNEAAR